MGQDLLAIRAFSYAKKKVIRSEWGASEGSSQRVWNAAVALDVVIRPCMMANAIMLVNLRAVIAKVSELQSSVIAAVTGSGTQCIKKFHVAMFPIM